MIGNIYHKREQSTCELNSAFWDCKNNGFKMLLVIKVYSIWSLNKIVNGGAPQSTMEFDLSLSR